MWTNTAPARSRTDVKVAERRCRGWIATAVLALAVTAAVAARPADALAAPALDRTPAPATTAPTATAPAATAPTATAPGDPLVPPAGGANRPRVLFGMGSEADSAARAQLTKQTPVHMLTSWYNGPGDLGWMTGWRTTLVPRSYAAGYALHLIVYAHEPEATIATAYGPACGRTYPLSDGFLGDMRQLADTFAGPATGPALYVTLFTEFQTFPCKDNAWSPDAATTNYYLALKDQYRAAYQIFHQYAPNAHVAIGWGGWQASYDDPGPQGGRSMFSHFSDIMAASDFQSFQAMDSFDNVQDIADMTSILGKYGPVMLAHYKPNNKSKATFDHDVRAIFTDDFMTKEVAAGLFAFSFMDPEVLNQMPDTFRFVNNAVYRYWQKA